MTLLKACAQPFNHGYDWLNTSDNEVIINPVASQQNTFTGSITQQATSVVTATNPGCYEYEAGCASIYGFEVSFINTNYSSR
jgi:beta-glucan synthesis-associated protein KRE6